MNIETDIATSVATEMKEKGGIHIPSNIVKGRRIHFAVDNTDFKNDTADGKNEFHGTRMTVFQTSIDDCPTQRIKIKRSKNATMKFKEVPFIQQKECFKPNPPTESFPTFEGIVSKDLLNLYKEKDKEWAFCQVADERNICILPTWAATNSLLLEPVQKTICQNLPLYPGPPTDWSNLYTSLNIVQGINAAVFPGQKTIVSLDLQLYVKCMQLREKDNISKHFVFRLGELHIVFAMHPRP